MLNLMGVKGEVVVFPQERSSITRLGDRRDQIRRRSSMGREGKRWNDLW